MRNNTKKLEKIIDFDIENQQWICTKEFDSNLHQCKEFYIVLALWKILGLNFNENLLSVYEESSWNISGLNLDDGLGVTLTDIRHEYRRMSISRYITYEHLIYELTRRILKKKK